MDKQFVNTLEDNIIHSGAPSMLISNHSQAIISNKIVDILHALSLDNLQIEPHQQQQNPAEHCLMKTAANHSTDHTGDPSNNLLLCLLYEFFLFEKYIQKDNWQNQSHTTTGSSSILPHFYFCQKFYYNAVYINFPFDSPEAVDHIFGISDHCGHVFTWTSYLWIPTASFLLHLFTPLLLMIPTFVLKCLEQRREICFILLSLSHVMT
jgi:hypothetical protein